MPSPSIPSILLTGFGPFPGALDNPTAHLVDLMRQRCLMHPPVAYQLHCHVLPVEWQRGKQTFAELFKACRPAASLHLGYAETAKGFQLEACAHNQTCEEPDAADNRGHGKLICEHSAARLHTELPLQKIEQKLQTANLHVVRSSDAGRYLCNYLYYLSLQQGQTALFVHLPAVNTEVGLFPIAHEGAYSLNENEAIAGLDIILAVLADFLTNSKATFTGNSSQV